MDTTLEAAGLVKAFGGTRALDGLDLTMRPGQVLALLGPNGAGKTTFVSLVATLLRPDGAASTWPALTWCATHPPCAGWWLSPARTQPSSPP